MIFVSFGHDSHELLVKRLVEDLKKNNIDVWVDYDCLYGSSSWEEEIERGIKNSDLVILFLTNHSMRRPDGFCINEVSYANFYHKKILPIKIHNVTPLISISKIQWIDMSKYLCEDGSIDEELYSQKIKDIIDIIENNKEITYDCNELDYIKSCLHPLDNESYLLKDKNFVGRTYLFDEYNKWKESNNKVFCLIGNAGSGKSSFIKELSFRDSSIVGIHFCINKNNERANIKNIFASLAYHVATQIEEYQNLLFSYSSLNNIFEQEPKRMFEILFVELLSKVHLTSNKVIVIDAIDEVLNNDLDILLEIISNMSSLTPKWLKILLTSRRSLSIEQRIHNVTLFDLSNYQLETNNDIKEYFLSSINDELNKYDDIKKEQIINQLIKNANGLFIYCSLLVNEINKGIILLDNIDSIPSSIYKVYLSYFDRLLAATSINYSDVRKVLEVLLYWNEQADDDTIQSITKLDEYTYYDIKELLSSLFPIIDNKITLLHKSTKDFLKERNNSLKYYVSETIASKNISYYLISLVKEEKYNDYIFKNFITHLLDAKLYSEVSYYLSLDEFNNKWLDRIDRFKYLDSYITSLLRLGNEDLSYYKVVINSNYFINLVKQYYSYFSITDIFYKLHSYHELTFFKDLDSKEVNQIDHVLLISFAFYYNNIRQYSKVREFLQPYVYNKELIHNLLGDNTRYLNEYYYELLSQYVTSLYYLIEYDEIMNIYNELLDKSSTFLDMPSKCVILSIVAKVELCLGNHTKSNELFNQVIDCFKESIRTSSYTNQFINRIYYKNILRELLIIKIALNDIDESINIEKEFKNITIQNNSIIYENINQKAEIAKMLYNALNHEDVKNDYEYLINSSLTTFDKAFVTIVYNISLMLNDKLEEVYYKYTLEKYVTREDYLLHALHNMILSSFGMYIEYNYSNDALKKYERLDSFINYLKEVLFSKILEKDENII